MALYTIQDLNGNHLYNDKRMTSYTTYGNLKEAQRELAKLPKGYFIRDTITKKKVETK